MEALFLNSSSSFSPSKPARVPEKHDRSLLRRKKISLVHCQGGGNAIKTNVLTQRAASSAAGTDHGAAVVEKGSLVLAPNGKSQADNVAVKDLVTYQGSQSTSSLEIHDGIGIVNFLRGKSFFVTGATGFLAKGTFLHYTLYSNYSFVLYTTLEYFI